jgi:hypothetical protein
VSTWALAALGAVALAIALSGCSSSGYHYVANKGDHTYFKVPEKWTLYDTRTVLDQPGSGLTEQDKENLLTTAWLTAFDASPKPSLAHVSDPRSRYPTGQAQVEQLSADTADSVSLAQLRNLVVNVDQPADGSTATVIQYDHITRSGGFHGIHLVARVDKGKASATYNEIALLDTGTTKLYLLAVSCSTTCYEHNQSKIEQIIDSWTVKDS